MTTLHPFDRFAACVGTAIASLIIGGSIVDAARAQTPVLVGPSDQAPTPSSTAADSMPPARAVRAAADLLRERVDWGKASPQEAERLYRALAELAQLAQSLETPDRTARRLESRP